jgi:Undecaprenyl-phosphate glucose phosphotransferase
MNNTIELEEDLGGEPVVPLQPSQGRDAVSVHKVTDRRTRANNDGLVGRYRPVFFVNFLIIADLLALLIAVFFGHISGSTSDSQPSTLDYSFLYLSSLVTLVCLHMSKTYRFAWMDTFSKQADSLMSGCCVAFFFIVTSGFLSGSLRGHSNVWMASSALIAFCMLVLNRILIRNVMQHALEKRQLSESIVVVGANEHAAKLMQKLQEKSSCIDIVGIFDDRVERSGSFALMSKIVGSTDELIAFVRNNRVDRVVVTLPWIATDRINAILKKLRTVPVRIDLVPNDVIWQFAGIKMETLGGVPILNVANARVDSQIGIVKRMEDIVLSSLLLILASPLLLLIACAIKLDSKGPVLFKQRRHGFNNEIFEVYKFRSMSHSESNSATVEQATRHDARVTSVGGFLRRSSFDELPQLFNVLLGQMSIVGPRPHAVQHNVEYGSIISEYFARHNVRPGITGWAQVNGLRGETDTVDKMHRRVDADLYYIENWSLMLDLRIIILTAMTVWFQENAY